MIFKYFLILLLLFLPFKILDFKVQTNNYRESASQFSNRHCLDSIIYFHSETMARRLRDELPFFQKELHSGFKGIHEFGFWKFRSKNKKSISAKLKSKY